MHSWAGVCTVGVCTEDAVFAQVFAHVVAIVEIFSNFQAI